MKRGRPKHEKRRRFTADKLGFPLFTKPKRAVGVEVASVLDHSPFISPYTHSLKLVENISTQCGKSNGLLPIKSLTVEKKKTTCPSSNNVASQKDKLTPRRPKFFIDKDKFRFINVTNSQKMLSRSFNSPRHHKIKSDVRTSSAQSFIPVHSDVESFSADIHLSGNIETGHSSLIQLFMEDWLKGFEKDETTYNSIMVHGEIGLSEIKRLTANLNRPNEFMTAFCCILLERMVPFFGQYADLMHLLLVQILRSIYNDYYPNMNVEMYFKLTPFFSTVKYEQKQVEFLRKKCDHCTARNSFLEFELKDHHERFEKIISLWGSDLLRSYLYGWYDITITRKKGLQKNIAWFNKWFSGSSTKLLGRIISEWSRWKKRRILKKVKAKIDTNMIRMEEVQHNMMTLESTLELLQAEHEELEMDNKQIESKIHELREQIDLAKINQESSLYEKDSILYELQMRAEITTDIGPLVLESLLRSQYNLGFQQQHIDNLFLYEKSMDEIETNFEEELRLFLVKLAKNYPTSFKIDCLNEIGLGTQVTKLLREWIFENADSILQVLCFHMHDCKNMILFTTPQNSLNVENSNASFSNSTVQLYEVIQDSIEKQNIHYASVENLLFPHHVKFDPEVIFPSVFPSTIPDNYWGDLGIINGQKRFDKDIGVAASVICKSKIEVDDGESNNNILLAVTLVTQVICEYVLTKQSCCDLTPYTPSPVIDHALHSRLQKSNIINPVNKSGQLLVEIYEQWNLLTADILLTNLVQKMGIDDSQLDSYETLSETTESEANDCRLSSLSSISNFKRPCVHFQTEFTPSSSITFDITHNSNWYLEGNICNVSTNKVNALSNLLKYFEENMQSNICNAKHLKTLQQKWKLNQWHVIEKLTLNRRASVASIRGRCQDDKLVRSDASVLENDFVQNEMQSPLVKVILKENKDRLKRIFKNYGTNINKANFVMEKPEWNSFVQDFSLLDDRFLEAEAVSIFKHSQLDANTANVATLNYREFCVAISAIAAFKNPNPFMTLANKISQFLESLFVNSKK